MQKILLLVLFIFSITGFPGCKWSEMKKDNVIGEPNVILHITYLDDWNQALKFGEYRPKSLDIDGYIHCSKPSQIIKVANDLFKAHTGLVLLVIDPKKVHPEIKYEGQKSKNLFPHIYGPLNLDAVMNVLSFPPKKDGFFELPEKTY